MQVLFEIIMKIMYSLLGCDTTNPIDSYHESEELADTFRSRRLACRHEWLLSIKLHGLTSQRTVIFTFAVMRNSRLTNGASV